METFRIFKEPNEARAIATLLTNRQVTAVVREVVPSFNSSIVAAHPVKEYEVLLHAADFTQAGQLLRDYYRQQLHSIPEDYYLFSFTDAELFDLLRTPDKWGDLDYVLAVEILNERGINIPDAGVADLEEKRLKELKKPEQLTTDFFHWRDLLSVLFCFPGLLTGWHLMHARKILPDGTSILNYALKDRKRGAIIFYCSAVIFIVGVIIIFYRKYQRDAGI